MKLFLILWMIVNAGAIAWACYIMYGDSSADDKAGAAFVVGVPAMASCALWLIVLVVWLIVKA